MDAYTVTVSLDCQEDLHSDCWRPYICACECHVENTDTSVAE